MADNVIEWEWDVETVATVDTDDDAIGDVIDHSFCRSYAECLDTLQQGADEDTKYVVVLVRTDWSRKSSKCWAYLKPDGTLPEYASDAHGIDCHKVPKRYHAEVARAVKVSAIK